MEIVLNILDDIANFTIMVHIEAGVGIRSKLVH